MTSSKTNIFSETIRPDEKLFFHKNDPHDLRMGEHVTADKAQYSSADIVILGCPQDEGVRRNNGRAGAHEAPVDIRRALYKFPVPEKADELNIFDLGDLKMSPTLEETHQRHEEIVYRILQDGKTVVVLGGGNDISYPDCSALSRVTERSLTAFNIDSHFDVRDSYPRNSGTPYRQLLEGEYLHPPHFYEIACKELANSPVYREYLEEKGVAIYTLEQVREIGVDPLFKKLLARNSTDAVFWGFDIDAVRANDAPGASASYPVGLTAEEICQIAALAGQDKRSRLFEITEVNPRYDIDGRTAKLAAMMIIYFISEFAASAKDVLDRENSTKL